MRWMSVSSRTTCWASAKPARVAGGLPTRASTAMSPIAVVYETLPPIGDIAVAARVGNPPATRAGFAEAQHVVRLETDIQRFAGVPMEPRAALGHYDPVSDRYTVYAGGGAIVRPKKEIAIILGVPPEKVRVIAR